MQRTGEYKTFVTTELIQFVRKVPTVYQSTVSIHNEYEMDHHDLLSYP